LSFLLDTNICSATLRGDRRLFTPFMQYAGRLHTSRIVLAELYSWAYIGKHADRRMAAINRLLGEVRVLEFDDDAAQQFGRLIASAPRGVNFPPVDLLIASTAIVHGFTLVTHDVHFADIPGLTVVDWLKSYDAASIIFHFRSAGSDARRNRESPGVGSSIWTGARVRTPRGST
jgi:tRNA(fMet)-specific endonuclease VapC